MIKYILKKVISKIFILFIVTIMVFILANISQVDPAESYARRTSVLVTDQQIEEVREELGLNDPIIIQYKNWLNNIIHYDFGKSLITGNKISDDIKPIIGPTFLLVITATIFALIVGIFIGAFCAIYKDGVFDRIIRFITLFGISVPGFWIGFLLVCLFAIKLNVIPVVSKINFKCLILPSITMAIGPASQYIRLIRNNILDNMNKDYVLYSRARGLPKRIVIYKHVLKNAIQPLIPIFFQNFANFIISSAIVESVFTWPGMGLYMIRAVICRDFKVVAFYVLLSAVIFSICSVISDVVNVKLNKQLMKDKG
ncbi:ABC transporter permease [Inediibacterium massiliense]|uniref:ABC transporter permease n=1 Tax=Inediibacterium massiliense TaxID=1658111 RepID=UPI0006B618AE|nr:ABC transporter permease [Inediibacterium massiliense]